MHTSELFSPRENLRVPVRPLGMVSEYVVAKLPGQLARIRAGNENLETLISFARSTASTVGDTALATFEKQPDLLDLSLLDLLYLQHGIIHSGGVSPVELDRTIQTLSLQAKRLPTLTYEDLIFINPTEDRRTFSEGNLAQTERDFYTSHVRMEKHLEEIVRAFTEARSILLADSPDVSRIHSLLASTQSAWVHVHEHMRDLVKYMSATEFAEFRDYFTGNAAQGYIGPSGAFSYRVPLVEAMLAAEKMKTDQLAFIQTNIEYFPRDGQHALLAGIEIANQGTSLQALSKSRIDSDELHRQLLIQDEALNTFRQIHFSAVRRHQPEVANGNAAGASGGTQTYLEERIYPHIL